MDTSQVRTFFRNQNVFITGGTGFLGKVLVEKLIRVCEPKMIYLLVRPKKGRTVEERAADFFSYPCFDRVKSENREIEGKVCFVSGDCKASNLGLTEEDEKMLIEETTVVIHAAANVKFDQSLREAASNNVKSTVDILGLAKKMFQLKAFVFVSTAYSNCIYQEIKEEFYPPPMSYEQLFSLLDALDDYTLEAITPKLLGKWPNTYVYTKCISEDAVKILGKDLPLAIVRPGIVINTIEEPMPGWIDNFYGPMGLFAAAALGILRSVFIAFKKTTHAIPVDYVSNLVLVAAWSVCNARNTTIYNFIGHRENFITLTDAVETIKSYSVSVPSVKSIWYYSLRTQENETWHKVCSVFLHTIPAYIIDFILFCLGRPRIAAQIYLKVDNNLKKLSYFITRTWEFKDDNVMNLWEKLDDGDKKYFKFNMKNIVWNEFLRVCYLGGRVHLLKDPLETVPKAKIRQRVLFVAHYTVIAIFWILVFKLLSFLLNILLKQVNLMS